MDVIIPFLIELFCQVCIMGFNPILTDKLLNEYSYSKNIKFYCALYILSICYAIIFIFLYTKDKKTKKKNCCANKNIGFYFVYSFGFLFVFIIFTFISSVCYFTDDNLKRERWNNIIMAEFIYFKVLDFQILSFFDFLDNSDIFNTSLVITFEKLLWIQL